MRVLGSSVLVFEAIMVALFIPVAYFTGLAASGSLAAWVGVALVVLCLVATALLGRPIGVTLGWVVQGLVLATALLVPLMLVLGLVFAGLWWAALRYGGQVDAMRAARAQNGAPDASGTRSFPGPGQP
jgi:hypothetical protein